MFDGRLAECLGVCKVDMRTALYHQLVKLLYGDGATPAMVMERWLAHAFVMGHRENAISKTECLFVRFRKISSDGEK